MKTLDKPLGSPRFDAVVALGHGTSGEFHRDLVRPTETGTGVVVDLPLGGRLQLPREHFGRPRALRPSGP